MRTITQEFEIHAPLSLVWQALVKAEQINLWGGGPAIMDDHEGTEFSLWGGSIHGINTKVIPEELLEQDWYSGDDWPQASKVHFTLEEDGDHTIIELVHRDIPDEDVEDIDESWHEYYFGPLQKFVEAKAHAH